MLLTLLFESYLSIIEDTCRRSLAKNYQLQIQGAENQGIWNLIDVLFVLF